ncbi:unnamed protein product [Rhizoctonia solani]|uniref:Nephrocystin 3-like N-terminal domain-containing protein n=1 Tax=Rhizoctonia solani TaxID=456999 RepID=A0A8H3DL86_9AGAM|nr:unnamed protein product [Rhizoctonia solani]
MPERPPRADPGYHNGMFRFSSVKGDRSSGGSYLRQLQREIRSKVKGPVRANNEERNTTWKTLEKALRALHSCAQFIPPLESAIDGLVSILDVYEDAAKARKDHENLALSLVSTIDILKQQLQGSSSTRINDKMLEIASLIEEEVLIIRNRQDRNGPSRIANALENEDPIRSYQRVEQLFHRIQLEIGMSAWRTAHEHLEFARKSVAFQSALGRVLEQDPDIASRDISTQFRRLFLEPLQGMEQRLPENLVIVVDALDECEDAQAAGQLLSMLLKHATALPVKFFLTSRPELELAARIQREFRTHEICSTSHLHEVERSTVQSDIELYLMDELEFMNPSSSDIKRLAESSGQLFIYAVTAVRYIRPGTMGVDHYERLETMLAVTSSSQKRFAHIDALYSTILSAALDNVELEPNERNRILQVLWTVVCLRVPMHIGSLKEFTGFRDVKQTLAALQPLRSVLYVSEKSSYISVLHQSFPDYILDPKRSRGFSCDSGKHNQLLSQRCFNLMRLGLKFNICDLKSSFVRDRDVVDIKERIDNNIPDSLAYACRYWGDHLRLSNSTNEFITDVTDFLCKRLLFWMEVLNLNECIGIGVGALLKLQSWLARQESILSKSPYLLTIASDMGNFVAGFAGQPVSISTPHIYISALALAPDSSYVTRLYRAGMQGLLEETRVFPARAARPASSGPHRTLQSSSPGDPINSILDQGNMARNMATQQIQAQDTSHYTETPSTIMLASGDNESRLVYGIPPIIPPSAALSNAIVPIAHMPHQNYPWSAAPRSAPQHPLPLSRPTAPTLSSIPSTSEVGSSPLIGTRMVYTTPQATPHAWASLTTPPVRFVRANNSPNPKAHSPGNYSVGYAYQHRRESTKSIAGPNSTGFHRESTHGQNILTPPDTIVKTPGGVPGSYVGVRQAYPPQPRSTNDTLLTCKIDEESSEIRSLVPYAPLPTAQLGHAAVALYAPDAIAEPRRPEASQQLNLDAHISSLNYPWQVRSDGWILNRNEGLLIYIPPEKNGTFRNLKQFNGSKRSILPRVDWGKMYVGDQWTRCYYGN